MNVANLNPQCRQTVSNHAVAWQFAGSACPVREAEAEVTYSGTYSGPNTSCDWCIHAGDEPLQ